MADRIGVLLVEEGLVSQDDLKQALGRQKTEGGKLGYHLVSQGAVSVEDLVHLLSEQYGIPAIDLRSLYPHVERELLELIPEQLASRYHVFPVHKTGNILTLAMADPTNVVALDDIRFRTGCETEPVLASEFAFKEAIEHSYEEKRLELFGLDRVETPAGPTTEEQSLEVMADEEELDASNLEQMSADAPVVRIVKKDPFEARKVQYDAGFIVAGINGPATVKEQCLKCHWESKDDTNKCPKTDKVMDYKDYFKKDDTATRMKLM